MPHEQGIKQSEVLYSYTQKHDYGSKNAVVIMQSLLPLTAFLLLHFYSFFWCVDEQGIKQAEALYSYTQKHGYGRDQVRLFKAPYTSS